LYVFQSTSIVNEWSRCKYQKTNVGSLIYFDAAWLYLHVIGYQSNFSHFYLVLVVENFESLSILDHFCALFQFQLQQRVWYNSNSDIDGLDIVFDSRDGFFDVGERCIVWELLASVINFALDLLNAFINFWKFCFESFNIFAYSSEASLDFSKLVGVSAVITSHSLEISREDTFFARYLLKSTGCIVLKSFELASNLW